LHFDLYSPLLFSVYLSWQLQVDYFFPSDLVVVAVLVVVVVLVVEQRLCSLQLGL
jgi:hypothetical protein